MVPAASSPSVCLYLCEQSRVQSDERVAVVDFFLTQALRANTRRLYGQHWVKFTALCQELGYTHSQSQPISEQDFCYLLIIYAHRQAASTLPGFLSAIKYSARANKLPELPQGEQVQKVLTGLSKWFSSSDPINRAASITTEQLLALHRGLDVSEFAQARDWAAYVIAFFAMLRISEYTGTTSLRWRHVKIVSVEGVEALVITVPFSKTESRPVEVVLASLTDELCPVKAFRSYQRAAGDVWQSWPFFLARSGRPEAMGRAAFIGRLRQRLRAAGFAEVGKVSGHSFRRGGLTALLLAGVSDTQLQRHGRWKSDSFKRYFDTEHSIAARVSATREFAARSSTHGSPSHSGVEPQRGRATPTVRQSAARSRQQQIRVLMYQQRESRRNQLIQRNRAAARQQAVADARSRIRVE